MIRTAWETITLHTARKRTDKRSTRLDMAALTAWIPARKISARYAPAIPADAYPRCLRHLSFLPGYGAVPQAGVSSFTVGLLVRFVIVPVAKSIVYMSPG
jgi:hypothetical protein